MRDRSGGSTRRLVFTVLSRTVARCDTPLWPPPAAALIRPGVSSGGRRHPMQRIPEALPIVDIIVGHSQSLGPEGHSSRPPASPVAVGVGMPSPKWQQLAGCRDQARLDVGFGVQTSRGVCPLRGACLSWLWIDTRSRCAGGRLAPSTQHRGDTALQRLNRCVEYLVGGYALRIGRYPDSGGLSMAGRAGDRAAVRLHPPAARRAKGA